MVYMIISWLTKKFFLFRKKPYYLSSQKLEYTQRKILKKILKNISKTTFGKDFNLYDLDSYEIFSKKVPSFSYEKLSPYINRMLGGEPSVLVPKKVLLFSKSSGTTNDTSKYIPVTKKYLKHNHYKAGKDIYTFFFNQCPESNILDRGGKVFSLGGSLDSKTEQGITIGDVSALIMSCLPKWAEYYRAPSLPVALMKKWEDKIPAMILDTKDKNITHISGVPTWFVKIFDTIQSEYQRNNILEHWTSLELFIHGAVAFAPYKKIFQDFFPNPDFKYLEVYNASEGFFALQDSFQKPGEMLLLVNHDIFYECIDFSEYGNPEAKIIPLWEVSLGKSYALIITNTSGLYRYDIGDTIEFTSLYPHRIIITGRTKHFINVFGEELMVGNTDKALAELSEEFSCKVENYTVAPIFMNSEGRGGHEWLIEFVTEPVDLKLFQKALDSRLQKLNSDYAAKRQQDIALQELVLQSIPRGTFYRWLESKGKLGGQYKVPRLSNKRIYLEEILGFINK